MCFFRFAPIQFFEVDTLSWFRVQVEDEEFYDGPDESEHDSEDSNGIVTSSSCSFSCSTFQNALIGLSTSFVALR